MKDEESDFAKALRRAMSEDPTLPPIPPGQVRPLTDPEAVVRWIGTHQGAKVVSECDLFDIRHVYEDECDPHH
jgi:hypothetical protein